MSEEVGNEGLLRVLRLGIAVAVVSVAGGPGCRPVGGESDAVDVTYAASLTATMAELEQGFREEKGRAVRGDPRGSVAGAHLIREGVWRRDVYITADPATLRLLGPHDPGWAVVFARSEIVIAYSEESRFAPALDSAGRRELAWPEVALRGGFRLGRTDPDLDPKGYRALFAFQLAEQHYSLPGLADILLAGPAGRESVFPEEHLSARVQTGSLDAGIFYLAEAKAHGLRVVRLPRMLGQGDPRDTEALGRLQHRTADARDFQGSPIAYAATVPLNARDSEAGGDFIAFLLSDDAEAILTEDGFVPESWPLGDRDRMPRSLSARLNREAARARRRRRSDGTLRDSGVRPGSPPQ
jgi:molybdate/tungstate transport system substrate-binding protein